MTLQFLYIQIEKQCFLEKGWTLPRANRRWKFCLVSYWLTAIMSQQLLVKLSNFHPFLEEPVGNFETISSPSPYTDLSNDITPHHF